MQKPGLDVAVWHSARAQRSDIRVAKRAHAASPNLNDTNDKNGTKCLYVFQFQFLLASLRTTVHVYNSI